MYSVILCITSLGGCSVILCITSFGVYSVIAFLGVYSVVASVDSIGEAKSSAELYLSGKGPYVSAASYLCSVIKYVI